MVSAALDVQMYLSHLHAFVKYTTGCMGQACYLGEVGKSHVEYCTTPKNSTLYDI